MGGGLTRSLTSEEGDRGVGGSLTGNFEFFYLLTRTQSSQAS